MKNFYLYFSLILILLLVSSSCNVDPTVSNELIELDTHAAIKNKKHLKLSDIAQSVEFVKLETSSECLISGGSFVLGEKYIVFLNYRPGKVMLFDRSGKFLRDIGRVGQGPGEYKQAGNIDLNSAEDKILVESAGFPSVLLEYSINGDFIRSNELLYRSQEGVKYLANGEFIYMQGRYYSDSLNYPRIISLDEDMGNPTTLYTINHKRNPDRMAGYYTRDLFSRLKSGFNFKDSMCDTVYFVDEKLEPTPKYVIVEGEKTPPYYSMTLEESDSYQNNMDMLNELSEYLLLLGKVNGKRAHLVYDKINGEFFSLPKQDKCLSANSYSYGLLDDLTGLEPYWFWESADLRNNSFHDILGIIDLKDAIESDCFNDDNRLISTKYRDQLKSLVESSSEDDNPIIRIIHLK